MRAVQSRIIRFALQVRTVVLTTKSSTKTKSSPPVASAPSSTSTSTAKRKTTPGGAVVDQPNKKQKNILSFFHKKWFLMQLTPPSGNFSHIWIFILVTNSTLYDRSLCWRHGWWGLIQQCLIEKSLVQKGLLMFQSIQKVNLLKFDSCLLVLVLLKTCDHLNFDLICCLICRHRSIDLFWHSIWRSSIFSFQMT